MNFLKNTRPFSVLLFAIQPSNKNFLHFPLVWERPTLSSLIEEIRLLLLLLIGVSIAAFSYTVFQVPYNIAAGGVTGISIIVNRYTDWPIGTIYLVLNIPLMAIGFVYLGRWAFLRRTMIAVFTFGILTEIMLKWLPVYLGEFPVTNDVFLSAVYAGIIGGIGGGIVYRSGATMGGTGILGRIIQMKTGTPLSQIYLYTDGVIVLAAGVIFGWETALYAMLTLLLSGMASDYTMEGASRTRMAMIITSEPRALIEQIELELGRGSTYWTVVGGHTGEEKTVVQCAVFRPQVNTLKSIVRTIDPDAFMSVGVTQTVIGQGFGYT